MQTLIKKTVPFVSWPGGKTRLSKFLIKLIPKKFNHYYEPFLGGGAMFLAVSPESATLSDVDTRLINCYKAIRDDPHSVINHLYDLHKERELNGIRIVRSVAKRRSKDRFQDAANFIFMTKNTFNSKITKGFTEKYGCERPRIFYANSILVWSELLKKTSIKNCSYDGISPSKGDFVYLDPPYFKRGKGLYVHGNDLVSLEGQMGILRYCKKLDGDGVFFMMSNTYSRETLEMYKEFNCIKRNYKNVMRSLSVDKVPDVPELIVTNY